MSAGMLFTYAQITPSICSQSQEPAVLTCVAAEMDIPHVLEASECRMNAPALSWYRGGTLQRRFTYQDLRQRVSALAGSLIQFGVRPGDRVVVLSSNSSEMYFLLLSVMSLGAIVVPINPRESPRMLSHVISTVEPALIVCAFSVERLVELVASDRPTISIDEIFGHSAENRFDFSAVAISADDTAAILFTSGTTSEPKGVCLSHRSLLTNARGLHKIHALAENTVHLCVLPLFHANAFGFSLITSVSAGSHVVLCDGFPGYVIWTIIAQERVNIVSVAPQMLQLLSARPPSHTPPPGLRYFVSAAAPLTKKLASKFISMTGVKIHQGYGLSECVNFATTIPGDIDTSTYEQAMFGEQAPSIGIPLEGCDVFVRNPQSGMPASPGEVGEIVVTGGTLMSGYWKNEETSRNVIIDQGLRTGDLGYYRVLGERRFFFITGREKEIIIRNGENISPLAVEAELQELHELGRFAVAGFENAATGEEIGLYLQVEDEIDREFVAHVVSACASLVRPRLVMFGRQGIPVTVTGKIQRAALGKRFSAFADHAFGTEPLMIEEPGDRSCKVTP